MIPPRQVKGHDPWSYVLDGRTDDEAWAGVAGAGRFRLVSAGRTEIRFSIGFTMWAPRRLVHLRREGDAWRAWSCRKAAWLLVPFNPAWVAWDFGETRVLLAQRLQAAGIEVDVPAFPPASLVGRGPAGMVAAWSGLLGLAVLRAWLSLR